MENEKYLERFKMLTKYDTSKTLNENKTIIFEQEAEAAGDAPPVTEPFYGDTVPETKNVLGENQLIWYARKLGVNLNVTGRRLNFRVNYRNLLRSERWLNELKNMTTADGTNGIVAVKKKYTEIGWGDIIQDVNDAKVRSTEGLALKQRVLALLQTETEQPTNQENVPQPQPQKPTYHNCKDFPFKIYCKNQVILNIQKCLGLKADGYYGPVTDKALKDAGYDVTNGIDNNIYQTILKKCRESGGTIKKLEPTKSGEIAGQKLTPKVPTELKSESPENTFKRYEDKFYKRANSYVYKGEDLDKATLDNLTKYFVSIGYKNFKMGDKRYGEKYVWGKGL